jgi:hypothetical protein
MELLFKLLPALVALALSLSLLVTAGSMGGLYA